MKKKIGLYFGSFNPIHVGHLIIANYFVEYTDIDQLWFVVSPQSPFKKNNNLLPEYQRLELVHLAIEDDFRFRASDIEFTLEKPNYTVCTLAYLDEKYPDFEFTLLMGSDQMPHFTKWKNYETILEYYKLLVYLRPNFPAEATGFSNHPSISFVQAPMMEISSSFIRKSIKEGKDMRYMLPTKVHQYITEMHFFE
jgi:nicotinate-nucleotide adenylyltransferase